MIWKGYDAADSTSGRSAAASRWAARSLLGFHLVFTACQPLHPHPYPIGIYSVPDQNAQAVVAAAGFNLVVGSAEKSYLDSAQQLGLRVLASPGTSAGAHFDKLRATQKIDAYDRHPALWGWYLSDEPDLHALSPKAVEEANRFVKSLGARKPTALVLFQGGETIHYGRIADITMVDRYPVPWLPLANFSQHIRLARLGAGPDRPLMAVIQAFDWRFYPKASPQLQAPRPPTAQEMRCMTYSALARRANGVFYYCYNDGAWRAEEHPESWEALKSIVGEVNRLMPLFQAAHLWWPYVHQFEGTTGFNEALEASIIPSLLEVKKGNAFVAPGLYLLTVNTTDRALKYRITAPRKGTSTAEVLGESRQIEIRNGWLEDRFEPYAVHVFGPFPRSSPTAHLPQRRD